MSQIPTLSVLGPLATITLQRPEKRNRIEPVDIATIIDHCRTINTESTVQAVTIEASGPVWCSGFHLGALADGPEPGDHPSYSFADLCDQVEAIRVPTIAVIGGGVHGGGTDLALSCDFRVATSSTTATMPAARIGLQYYASGLRRFTERIGIDATKRFFLTGETLDANQLLHLGFLTEVTDEAELGHRVNELVAAIGELEPEAIRQTKAAINRLAQHATTQDLEEIQAGHLATLRSQAHRDALARATAARGKRPKTPHS